MNGPCVSAPPIPRDLLEYLQGVFPNKLPKAVLAPDALGVLVGQQNVVDHLRVQFLRQNPGTPLLK
jgi:hypothetical protein